MKNIFSQNTCLYRRYKTENIFSVFVKNLKIFDAIEKKAARVGTKKCTQISHFHVFFMIFDILKGCIVDTKRRHFLKQKLKRNKKKVQNLYISSFWGPLKGRSSRHKKTSHNLKIIIRFCR